MSNTTLRNNTSTPHLQIQDPDLWEESSYFCGRSINLVILWLTVIYLILALIFFGLKIWFTLSVTIIMPFEIIACSIQVILSIIAIIIINRPSTKAMHVFSIVFSFSVVLNFTAWIVLLAEVAVVSGPDSACANGSITSNCILVSQTIFILGIFLASFNFCFLFYDLLLFKLYRDFYGYLREQRAKKHTEKYKQYRNTLLDDGNRNSVSS